MKKKKNSGTKISIQDYVKAVKRVDRDIELSQSQGWTRITKVHTSKKTYNRKSYKDSEPEE